MVVDDVLQVIINVVDCSCCMCVFLTGLLDLGLSPNRCLMFSMALDGFRSNSMLVMTSVDAQTCFSDSPDADWVPWCIYVRMLLLWDGSQMCCNCFMVVIAFLCTLYLVICSRVMLRLSWGVGVGGSSEHCFKQSERLRGYPTTTSRATPLVTTNVSGCTPSFWLDQSSKKKWPGSFWEPVMPELFKRAASYFFNINHLKLCLAVGQLTLFSL